MAFTPKKHHAAWLLDRFVGCGIIDSNGLNGDRQETLALNLLINSDIVGVAARTKASWNEHRAAGS